MTKRSRRLAASQHFSIDIKFGRHKVDTVKRFRLVVASDLFY